MMRRREAIVVGAGAALAPGVARARSHRYDVVVVGAGMAGLRAASDLRAAGKDVLVLEARKRVGGRVYDRRAGGTVVELGGQWTGPGQDEVLALARRMGVKTFPTYADGDSIYEHAGTRQRYQSDLPPLSPVALAEAAALIVRLGEDAAGVPADQPWKAERAAEFDAQSLTTYIEQIAHTTEARQVAALAVRGVFGEEPSQISTLNLLAGITGCGGDFETLIGSAQSQRFEGGPLQLARGLAKGLPIRFGEEVTGVRRTAREAVVTTREHRYRAREVVLAMPLHLIGRLDFRPALPAGLDQFLQRVPMGSVIKANVVYDEPFWRADGLCAEVISTDGPVQIVYDNSPRGGSPGVLVAFLEADTGRGLLTAPQSERRKVFLDCLTRYFGPKAAQPRAYVDRVWAAQRFSGGAYGAITGPGVLTSLGPRSVEPVERIQLAGADLSPIWPGYIDGALRSGAGVAKGALERL